MFSSLQDTLSILDHSSFPSLRKDLCEKETAQKLILETVHHHHHCDTPKFAVQDKHGGCTGLSHLLPHHCCRNEHYRMFILKFRSASSLGFALLKSKQSLLQAIKPALQAAQSLQLNLRPLYPVSRCKISLHLLILTL